MARGKEKSVYVFKMGMHEGREIEIVPKSYIKWFIESKTFNRIKKEDKLAVIEYYREIEGLDNIKLAEKIKGTGEWVSISELPKIDSEVEVRPFSDILIFKGDHFVNKKGKAVSIYLVDEWRYTDDYLEKII